MFKSLKFAAIGLVSAITLATSIVVPASAAGGCGGGWYRGPNGACHRIGYGPAYGNFYGRGPSPYIVYGPRYVRPHCWRGRWGAWHCN